MISLWIGDGPLRSTKKKLGIVRSGYNTNTNTRRISTCKYIEILSLIADSKNPTHLQLEWSSKAKDECRTNNNKSWRETNPSGFLPQWHYWSTDKNDPSLIYIAVKHDLQKFQTIKRHTKTKTGHFVFDKTKHVWDAGTRLFNSKDAKKASGELNGSQRGKILTTYRDVNLMLCNLRIFHTARSFHRRCLRVGEHSKEQLQDQKKMF